MRAPFQSRPAYYRVILYEHPFNERVRTYLRLEYLFHRFDELIRRDAATDHHFALVTLFELVEAGSRSDLKSDLLKDLERHKQQFSVLRGNPSVSEKVLDQLLDHLEQTYTSLNQNLGKIGQNLTEHELLAAVRNRIAIPGGTCSFDLPHYHAWQHLPADQRRADVLRWSESFAPMREAVRLLLTLMRDNATVQKMMATGGLFQQSLAQGKFQLMRVAIDPALGVVPEISGNRLMVSVRMMRPDADGRLQHCTDDTPFEMALCQ